MAELVAAVEWAALHEPTGTGDAAYWWEAGHMVPLAGEGAPEIGEYAIAEFATALGVSTQSGRRLIGHGLEIACRLPQLWKAVQAGRVPAWRAVRVAEATMTLSQEAAGFVDRQVAAVAGRVSLTQLEHLVLEAKIRVEGMEREDPENPSPEVPDTRHVSVHTEQVSFTGTVAVTGELDLADALHLDQALAAGAEQLKLAGSAESLDARRATALGEMSRHQLALSFDQEPMAEGRGSGRRRRPVTLFVHVSEDALTGTNPVGRCENTRTPISTETIRAWCGHPDAVVTVKPILDLTGHQRVDQYELPDRLQELIDQRDGRRNPGSHATPWLSVPLFRISSSTSAGVRKPCRLRGLELSSKAMLSSMPGPQKDRSVPLGRYWRSRPLVFSLLPRCQGECGSQK